MTRWLVALDDADAGCGGKAAGLARLRRQGLPVPDGFVIPSAALAAAAGAADVEAALVAEATARARPLGRVAVRSSMSLEDGATRSAAGIFRSRIDVDPAALWPAVGDVVASAGDALVKRYAGDAPVAVNVIVQRFEPGQRVTVYTRRHPRDHLALIEPEGGTAELLDRAAPDARLQLALAAERAIDADAGADVELVVADQTIWVLQARPIVSHAVVAPRRPPPAAAFAFSALTPGLTWRWDAAHNPTPMSPAQRDLVELVADPSRFGVAAAGPVAPYRMRVVHGYLYATASTAEVAVPPDAETLLEGWRGLDEEMAAALTTAPTNSARDQLAAALVAYAAFYAIWSWRASPLIAAAAQALPRHLAGQGHRDADRLAASLLPPPRTAAAARITAAAAGQITRDQLLAEIGDLSPRWDLASPSFAETPSVLDDAIARARRRATLPLTPPTPGADLHPLDPRLIPLTRAALELAELDDRHFARAQRQVRTALLHRAAELRLADPDDIFWISLAEALAPSPPPAATLAAQARDARAAAEVAAHFAMPVAVTDGKPIELAPGLRGTGLGGRVVGPVFVANGDRPAPRGSVAVVRAVTPALALLLDEAAAIVAETGGLLGHGAALARELGVPVIVGCVGATELLTTGAIVEIDGDAGIVTLT